MSYHHNYKKLLLIHNFQRKKLHRYQLRKCKICWLFYYEQRLVIETTVFSWVETNLKGQLTFFSGNSSNDDQVRLGFINSTQVFIKPIRCFRPEQKLIRCSTHKRYILQFHLGLGNHEAMHFLISKQPRGPIGVHIILLHNEVVWLRGKPVFVLWERGVCSTTPISR